MIKIGLVGASGYVGYNLMKILLKQTEVELKIATSNTYKGKKIKEIFKDLDSDLTFTKISTGKLNSMDIVFLAVPHTKAKTIAKELTCKIIDMTKDHRTTDTYGLPEIFKEDIKKSTLIANPGCYATACILATYPIKDRIKYIVFDCISGYSGSGKNPKYDYEENIIAYSITDHNHIDEISKTLDLKFSFTPHVVNTFRGLMCTAHIFLKDDTKISTQDIKEKYRKFYTNTQTKIVDHVPCTKKVTKTPYCHIGGFEKDNNNQLVIISVIDNLMKGAASQAIENMNIMFGFKDDVSLK